MPTRLRRSFTLIEFMIVVAMIGLALTILASAFMSNDDRIEADQAFKNWASANNCTNVDESIYSNIVVEADGAELVFPVSANCDGWMGRKRTANFEVDCDYSLFGDGWNCEVDS